MALMRGKLFAGALFAGLLLSGTPQEQAQAVTGGGGRHYSEQDIVRLVHEKWEAIEQDRQELQAQPTAAQPTARQATEQPPPTADVTRQAGPALKITLPIFEPEKPAQEITAVARKKETQKPVVGADDDEEAILLIIAALELDGDDNAIT